jgi:regulator of sigma E protease
VIRVVGGLISGQVSMSQLGGPITIGRVSVEAARSGLEPLWSLIAFLSINVAVLNLLPIPILDGGQILLNLAEAAKGSAFSARTREYIMRAGLVAIALLFALVMFNDVKGLIGIFQ